MNMSALQTVSVTLLALAVIGLTGAGWLLHDCTFDQFLAIAGPSGGLAAFLHVLVPETPAAIPPPADPVEPPGDTTEAPAAK